MASGNTKRNEDKLSNDLYSTPTVALDAIWPYLEKEATGGYPNILEPCAGLHSITSYLDSKGCFVYTNELYPVRNNAYDYYQDFLRQDNFLGKYDLIVCNPPYNKAVEFVLKGFEHAPIQWHFLRMSFLEGQKRYQELFSLGKLSDVYIFTYRVSCPKGVDMEPSPNSVCYAWYRWDKNYCGQPRLHWLTKTNLGE